MHLREYLVEQVSKITNDFDITKAVFIITCDNASPNNTMLQELEVIAKDYKEVRGLDLQQPWLFTYKESDVCYIAYIINLAIQDTLKSLKAISEDKLE